MATSLFSPSWYRVASLTPRLRKHIEIHRHDYRGRIWFILQDHGTGRSHRISPAAYRLLGLMDGHRTVQQLWELAIEQLSARAPTQEETIRLLGQLHAADAMICDVPPDSRELFRRFQRHERMKVKQKIWSPLAVRIPIWDPDHFLAATLPLVRPLLSWAGLVLWAALVTAGLVLAVMHFGAITENIFDRVLTPENLLVLWLVYPAVKALHELGHGYAVKVRGGEVHEIGIMLLVLIPVPYVDASAASGFRHKYDRMLVGGIGIMVEMALASIALIVWLNADEGPVHAIAYNVMLIGGVSTLLFNGNPLLRFDGYYVLADFLEIPNLGTRANKHIGYLVQKYLFGSKDAEPETRMPWERFWFVTYGVAAFIYRMFIMFVIILYIAGKFFILGVLLAIWAIVTQAVVPMSKSLKFLVSSPKLKPNRTRAVITTIAIAGAVGLLFFAAPFPYRTIVEGVIWPSDRSQIRANTDGFVVDVARPSRSRAARGDAVVIADDPFLAARADLLRAQIEGLELQRSAMNRQDRVEAQMLAEEIAAAEGQFERVRQRLVDLTVRAPRDGMVILPDDADLMGRYLRKGALIGYILDEADALSVRMVVSQDDVGLVRSELRGIEIMPGGWDAQPVTARIVRETPGGAVRIPTPALGVMGGGTIPTDPRDPDGVRTLERYFEFELRLPDSDSGLFLGRRVTIKLDHGYLPVGFQLIRSLRQLFLRLYGV